MDARNGERQFAEELDFAIFRNQKLIHVSEKPYGQAKLPQSRSAEGSPSNAFHAVGNVK